MPYIKIPLVLFFVFNIFSSQAAHLDSLRLISKGGSQFVIHQVEQGETLFGLSRRYRTTTDEILNANSEANKGIFVGQKLNIPVKKSSAQSNGGKSHTVKPSETLFSISKQYDVSVNDIKEWNNLSSNEIKVGQKLMIKSSSSARSQPTNEPNQNASTHVVQQSETMYSISRLYGVSVDELQRWNNLEGTALAIGQSLIVKNTANVPENMESSPSTMLPEKGEKEETKVAVVFDVPEEETTAEEKEDDNFDEGAAIDKVERKIETGLAVAIEDDVDTKKYLALHKKAPVGTIMQVKNEMNSQIVYVRIVGTFPDTGENQNILIKLSKKAYERLGAVDARFPVELSYIP